MKPRPYIHTSTYKNLFLCTLDQEFHEKTCGYWYLVYSDWAQSHTAFAKREHLLTWLENLDLALTADLPEHTQHSSQRLTGSYRTSMHMSYDAFYSLEGQHVRVVSNARYTLGIITHDSDGLRTLHALSPNCIYRPEYDYVESRALVG